MKQIFFFAILILLPTAVFGGGLLYLIWHTFYSFYDDWRLNQELEEIRAASRAKRAQAGRTSPPSDAAEGEFDPEPSDVVEGEFDLDDEGSSTTVANGDRQVPGDDA
jgi:hypothetical protein